jgi:hypothetical protein
MSIENQVVGVKIPLEESDDDSSGVDEIIDGKKKTRNRPPHRKVIKRLIQRELLKHGPMIYESIRS